MSPHRTGAGASGPRRPARDIIEAVVENMRKNLEPLKYSTLAPSRYVVYLHPSEYSRLDGIIPILQEQTTRALAEELERLNRRAPVRRWVDRWRGGAEPIDRNGAIGTTGGARPPMPRFASPGGSRSDCAKSSIKVCMTMQQACIVMRR